MHLVLLGLPGSGKGTQSSLLIDKLGFGHISTGNLLRAEVAKKSELGLELESIMSSGALVSDELVIRLLKANLNLTGNKYIFDGFPRTVAQAKTLDAEILSDAQYKCLYFEIDSSEVVKRLSARVMTKDGKYIYNTISNPPKVAGICDVTGEPLIQREDDKKEVIENRIKIFFETAQPILDFYKEKNLLVTLDASKGTEEIFNYISEII